MGGNLVTMARIEEVLKENLRAIQINPHDWPSIRGNASNSAQANGSQPLLGQPLWEQSILPEPSLFSDKEEAYKNRSKDRVEKALQQQRDAKAPVLSGFFPIATNKLAIYRTYADVRAVHLESGTDPKGEPYAAGDIAFRMGNGLGFGFDGSLFAVLDDDTMRVPIEKCLDENFNSFPGYRSFLYDNSLLGTLYADQGMVYAIDDLPIPIPAHLAASFTSPRLKSLVLQNSLLAFSIKQGGKRVWSLGVLPGDAAFHEDSVKDNPFANSHFLSVPLSVGGKLYVLNEKHLDDWRSPAELRLVCIDPNKVVKVANLPRPTVVSIQKLGDVKPEFRFTNDASRRTNAAHLAYSDGILICSTNAGMMLGVDLLSGSLAWSYPYRQQAAPAMPIDNMGNPFGGRVIIRPGFNQPSAVIPTSLTNWKSSPPVIQEGKVVFAAPDASKVHCVNLRDGAALWEKDRQEDDLFLAGVYSGKVLIVGQNSLRALSLSKGDLLWQVSTGDIPSGQGVASRNVYYLPLQNGEILAVDVERGTVKAHNRSRQVQGAPGNLLFYDGLVLSQTPEKIVAYPQLTVMLELANAELKKDPDNPEKLFKRGEMLLADGQLDQSVKDLRLALKNGLPDNRKPEARDRLYEALTDLLARGLRQGQRALS